MIVRREFVTVLLYRNESSSSLVTRATEYEEKLGYIFQTLLKIESAFNA